MTRQETIAKVHAFYSQLDWTKNNCTLAKENGLHPSTVWEWRRILGSPPSKGRQCREDRMSTDEFKAWFLGQLSPNSGDCCWEWMGARQKRGYGKCKYKGVEMSASRLAFKIFIEDPGELIVCHRCDNPPCCNPAHLFTGTNADNYEDSKSKGRHTYGTKVWNSKLNPELVLKIRKAEGTLMAIGKMFGISESHVGQIKSRKAWKQV